MKMNLNYVVASVLMISAMVLASCGKGGNGYGTNTNPIPASGNTVSIVNMSFSPANLNVSAGTTVTWTNNDAMTHTVTSDGGLFDSGNVGAGKTYSRIFSSTGTFPYHCTIHPGMLGTITVK
jgi:plastocyanin